MPTVSSFSSSSTNTACEPFIPNNQTSERSPQLNRVIAEFTCACFCNCQCTSCSCSRLRRRDGDGPWHPANLTPSEGSTSDGSSHNNTLAPSPIASHDIFGIGFGTVETASSIPGLTYDDTYESDDELSINLDPEERGARLPTGYRYGQPEGNEDDDGEDEDDEEMFDESESQYPGPFPRDGEQPDHDSPIDDDPHHYFLESSTFYDDLRRHCLPDAPANLSVDLSVSQPPRELLDPVFIVGEMDNDLDLTSSVCATFGDSPNKSSEESLSSMVSSLMSSLGYSMSGSNILKGVGAEFTLGSPMIPANSDYVVGDGNLRRMSLGDGVLGGVAGVAAPRGKWMRLL